MFVNLVVLAATIDASRIDTIFYVSIDLFRG